MNIPQGKMEANGFWTSLLNWIHLAFDMGRHNIWDDKG